MPEAAQKAQSTKHKSARRKAHTARIFMPLSEMTLFLANSQGQLGSHHFSFFYGCAGREDGSVYQTLPSRQHACAIQ